MRRITLLVITTIATLMLAATPSWAGSPHFVSVSITRTDDSLFVSGKEAGLGNEETVHIEVTATALCINGGGHHPKAVNKEDLSSGGDFPVQNGKADFSLTLTAAFDPPCSPPMTVSFTNVVVCDTGNGVCKSIPGTF